MRRKFIQDGAAAFYATESQFVMGMVIVLVLLHYLEICDAILSRLICTALIARLNNFIDLDLYEVVQIFFP